MTTWILVAATFLNFLLVVAGMSWQPNHQQQLASTLGIQWRGRPPLLRWRRLLKRLRIVGSVAGGAIFVLRKVLVGVLWALAGTLLSFLITTLAIWFAQQRGLVDVTLNSAPVDALSDVAAALVSHIASIKLHDGFDLTGLPTANISGDHVVLALKISLLAAVATLALRALSEWFKCLWYSLICVAFPRQAEDALEGRGDGFVRAALGLPPRTS